MTEQENQGKMRGEEEEGERKGSSHWNKRGSKITGCNSETSMEVSGKPKERAFFLGFN